MQSASIDYTCSPLLWHNSNITLWWTAINTAANKHFILLLEGKKSREDIAPFASHIGKKIFTLAAIFHLGIWGISPLIHVKTTSGSKHFMWNQMQIWNTGYMYKMWWINKLFHTHTVHEWRRPVCLIQDQRAWDVFFFYSSLSIFRSCIGLQT